MPLLPVQCDLTNSFYYSHQHLYKSDPACCENSIPKSLILVLVKHTHVTPKGWRGSSVLPMFAVLAEDHSLISSTDSGYLTTPT